MANSTASGSSRPGIPKIPDIKSAINDIKGSVAQPFVLPRKPRSDEEAQRLYYHIRTLCYWLDAANTIVRIPYLDKLPFTFGVEAIIGSLLPIAGDVIGGLLGFYVVLLCMQFGLPTAVLWKMFSNCFIDFAVGLVPFVGDLLDLAFKSNLRNLSILEDHLLGNKPPAPITTNGLTQPSTHFVVRIPPSGVFWPKESSPEVSAFQSTEKAHRSTSFFSNILGSPSYNAAGNTHGWKLGGVKKVDVEQAGGWKGEDAQVVYGWFLGLLRYVIGMIQGMTGMGKQTAQQGKKKAY